MAADLDPQPHGARLGVQLCEIVPPVQAHEVSTEDPGNRDATPWVRRHVETDIRFPMTVGVVVAAVGDQRDGYPTGIFAAPWDAYVEKNCGLEDLLVSNVRLEGGCKATDDRRVPTAVVVMSIDPCGLGVWRSIHRLGVVNGEHSRIGHGV
jgi:hypothetical protein